MSAFLAACSGDESPRATDSIFDGYSSDLVQEVLDNPGVQGNVQRMHEDERDRVWQANVNAFDLCRKTYGAYRQWLQTGQQPEVPEWELPAAPEPEFHKFADIDMRHVERLFHTNDPAELREYLVGEGACGSLVPVEPGDVSGPKIADAVRDE